MIYSWKLYLPAWLVRFVAGERIGLARMTSERASRLAFQLVLSGTGARTGPRVCSTIVPYRSVQIARSDRVPLPQISRLSLRKPRANAPILQEPQTFIPPLFNYDHYLLIILYTDLQISFLSFLLFGLGLCTFDISFSYTLVPFIGHLYSEKNKKIVTILLCRRYSIFT